jgi:hypothetical protein
MKSIVALVTESLGPMFIEENEFMANFNLNLKKNWLIRTRDGQISGPHSKEKVKELIESGRFNEDDEICSGNGFWFYLYEKELFNQYIVGDQIQSFNPLSEAQDMLNLNTEEVIQKIEPSQNPPLQENIKTKKETPKPQKNLIQNDRQEIKTENSSKDSLIEFFKQKFLSQQINFINKALLIIFVCIFILLIILKKILAF